MKYQCQSCHTIGGTGGYVGPNLNNAGNWLTPAWIEAWLRNPQALQPDTIEPRRNFTEEEIRALTAYLMTLQVGIKPQTSKSAANVRTRSRREPADEIQTPAGRTSPVQCAVRAGAFRLQEERGGG